MELDPAQFLVAENYEDASEDEENPSILTSLGLTHINTSQNYSVSFQY